MITEGGNISPGSTKGSKVLAGGAYCQVGSRNTEVVDDEVTDSPWVPPNREK